MKLKEYISKSLSQKENGLMKEYLVKDMVQIAELQFRFESLYGVKLDFDIKPIKPKVGRFFEGKGVYEGVITHLKSKE